MRKFLTICAILLSLSASAQWQQTGSKVRYVNGIGIPTKDTAAGVSADSSQILIRPADSSLYVKYKRTWQKVGSGGGGTVTGSGTTNYVSKFTSSTAIGNSQIFDNGTSVGIGTTSPSNKVDIFTTNRTALNTVGSGLNVNYNGSTTGQFATLGFSWNSSVGNNSTQWGMGMIGTNFVSGNADVNFFTDGVERMRITSAGNVGIDYTAPAAKLAVNGTALINTNTDNGVDKLQVSGSAVATVLKATGTGNNLAILNGTGTTNAYIDFQNAGTTQWRAGNDYNGGSRLFRINDVAGSVNTMLVNSSNQIGFNMPTTSFLGANSAMEFHKAGTQYIHRHFTYSSSGLGVQWIGYSTRSNTPGSFSATQINDPIIGFSAYGSSNSAHVFGADFFYTQKGATSTYIPGAWEFQASSGSVANQTRFYVHGADDNIQFWTTSTERMRVATSGRVLLNTTTDNGTDQLQVNGNVTATQYSATVQTLTDGATITFNASNGSNAVVTLGGNRTLAFSNTRTGAYYTLRVIQDGTGSRTLAMPASVKVIGGGAGVVTLSTAANSVDLISFYFDGTNYWTSFGQNYT
jgi:hypothetical protein